jgi:uncharacterized protein YaiI (UPF0178 family)
MHIKQRQVVVDGDACPRRVLEILQSLQPQYGYHLVVICSFHHRIEGPDTVIVVGDEPQATDLAVINYIKPQDIVVTQDWGLAAMVTGKGGVALSPTGMLYREDLMGFLLEERHVKAKLRRGGSRTKGPAPRSEKDDLRFVQLLTVLLEN